MARRRTLLLTAAQREELCQCRDHDPRPYARERCAALLRVADGVAPHRVARQGVLKPRDPDTIYGWLTCYEAEGLAGVLAHRHGGARGRHL